MYVCKGSRYSSNGKVHSYPLCLTNFVGQMGKEGMEVGAGRASKGQRAPSSPCPHCFVHRTAQGNRLSSQPAACRPIHKANSSNQKDQIRAWVTNRQLLHHQSGDMWAVCFMYEGPSAVRVRRSFTESRTTTTQPWQLCHGTLLCVSGSILLPWVERNWTQTVVPT